MKQTGKRNELGLIVAPLKTFSLSENQSSGKTYLYTIAPRYVAKRREVALHGLTGGLVLFEEVGRIKESSVASIPKIKEL